MQYIEPEYKGIPDDNTTRDQLASLLKVGQPILMAGAGSSCIIGYPGWRRLVNDLNSGLEVPVQKPEDEDIDLTAFADMIKQRYEEEKHIEDYYNFLERTFEPKQDRTNCDDFHITLVQLGFSGIVTTNYDTILEDAVMSAYTNENGIFRCETVDLCDDRPYRILDFMRDLSDTRNPRRILHIHGYYRTPKRIILTKKDYLEKYGELVPGEFGIPAKRTLDALHCKVLWSLLATHPLVFIGFSMQDEFFMQMLKIVQADFVSGSDPLHFAILDYTQQVDKEKTSKILRRNGVLPVFYYLPEGESTGVPPDHRGLREMVDELAESLGTPTRPTNLMALTKRMLER